jgi:hypothetical protein
MENRNGLAADVSHAAGTAERDTALAFIGRHTPRRITLAPTSCLMWRAS